MPSVLLDDRALIVVAGPEAENFLQNIVTTDLDALRQDEARAGALLSPQGKIMFDFLVSRTGEDRLRLDCRRDVATDFVKRLVMYRLRAKIEISLDEQSPVWVRWQNESGTSGGDSTPSREGSSASDSDSSGFRDMRFGSEPVVMRHYGSMPAQSDERAAWTALRIARGVVESGADYELGDAFPHDVLLDELGGVGFRKGCYVGQEVVSRMQHRGTARRRVLIAKADKALLLAGAEIRAGGKPIGTLGSVSGSSGLAIARIDKVKTAIDRGDEIVAGGVTLTLEIPAWAQFTFPTGRVEEAS